MSHAVRRLTATAAALAAGIAGAALSPTAEAAPPADARAPYTQKTAKSTGYGGAVTSVDPEASKIGIEVLRRGGNAVDAAVATAAALGVTEPYSAGIGGGGYFVHYNARTGRVSTLDGRETAPQGIPKLPFNDATGKPYRFTPELVTSGVSVGTPGTLATWDVALRKWGRKNLAQALRPAARLAQRGFEVDQTFAQQTKDNRVRLSQFPASRRLFLPGEQPPAVGSILRNPDLAATYRLIARQGIREFYRGALAAQIAQTVQKPPKADPPNPDDPTLPVPPGYLTERDLARYQVRQQRPTRISYRGLDVYGMAPSSSGGSTVGEALNILEQFRLRGMSTTQALHHYLEASALAFADRAEYVGDPAYVDVPLQRLLSDRFAAGRACQIDPTEAATKPVAAGPTPCAGARGADAEDTENVDTTNLTVVDRWGNIVEYTLTIEQTGGSAMAVPGRGFLLNNELTDFNYAATYDEEDPNRIQPGKRPRSSMSPTIVLRNGRPVLALGSPGGSTIITTVLQTLVNRYDLGMDIADALWAPRAAQRNTASVSAEKDFITAYGVGLMALRHTLTEAGPVGTSAAEIGAATAIELGRDGRLTAVSEKVRRGGGSALVVRER